ncbi:GNAT family N-acetyltransferase [Methanospirillum lacunae]|nr:GNAT family N-acetyltransferase [Methanospirillum lacunae]
MNKNSDVLFRTASHDDVDDLAKHHRKMFEEIWINRKIPFNPVMMEKMESNYIKKLVDEFRSGSCHAWIICRNEQVLSSGALSVCSYVPVPHDPSPNIAFLHSIYTEPEERGKGYARIITKEAIDYCQKNHIIRLYLFASETGKIIYEKEGFVSVDNVMMKLIKSKIS